MATTNVLQRSELGSTGRSRFDAEAFDASVMDIESRLTTNGGLTLGALTEGLEATKIGDFAEGITVDYCSISSVDARDGAMFPESMPAALLPSRAKWLVSTGDILISQVRPERGAVSLVPAHLDGAVASSGFYAVPSSKLTEGERAALYLFLRSALARRQLVRRNRNSMFPAVAPEDVASIVVPKFSEKDLARATMAVTGLVESRRKWHEAFAEKAALVDAFLAATGVPPSPLNSTRALDATTITRSAAFGDGAASRIDAEFFREEYSDYEEGLAGTECFELSEAFEVFAGAKVAGDDLVPIFKQAVLTNSGLNLSAVESEEAKQGGGVAVRQGDILVASTAHEIAYVGKKVDLVRDLPDEFADNQAVAELMILRPKERPSVSVSTSFVVDFLRHEAGRHQFQRCIRGLRGGHTYPRDIKKYVKVPLPDVDWMKHYDKLSTKTDAARAASIDLTRQSIAELEKSIKAASRIGEG